MLDDNEWDKALGQNLFAAVRLDRALLPTPGNNTRRPNCLAEQAAPFVSGR